MRASPAMFPITAADHIVPVCHQGEVRSQVRAIRRHPPPTTHHPRGQARTQSRTHLHIHVFQDEHMAAPFSHALHCPPSRVTFAFAGCFLRSPRRAPHGRRAAGSPRAPSPLHGHGVVQRPSVHRRWRRRHGCLAHGGGTHPTCPRRGAHAAGGHLRE